MDQNRDGPLFCQRLSLNSAISINVAVADLDRFVRQPGDALDENLTGCGGVAKRRQFPAPRRPPFERRPVEQHSVASDDRRRFQLLASVTAVRADRPLAVHRRLVGVTSELVSAVAAGETTMPTE